MAQLDLARADQKPVSAARRARRALIRTVLRTALSLHAGLVGALGALRSPRRYAPSPAGYEILLTGTFYSENWIAAHLGPLASSPRCARVRVVSVHPIPHIPRVEPIYPPARLVRLVGAVPARLLTFIWCTLRRRPDFVGGFHLLVNGLVAALLARIVGARSIYFCVGGPPEILDGGIWAENRVFGLIEKPDPVIERQLVKAVAAFDLVIAMGTRAVSFFRARGVTAAFRVVSGGIDGARFYPANTPANYDLILVGRLVPVKRIDLFLETVRHVADAIPEVRALIVGDGPLRTSCENLSSRLGLERNVTFVGHRPDVERWLRQAKVFVLTSDTEGLALSLMEAMASGLVPVVSEVGDLPDLVEDGVSGYLIRQRDPEAFAKPIIRLLREPDRRAALARAAIRAARRYSVEETARRWDTILDDERKGAAR